MTVTLHGATTDMISVDFAIDKIRRAELITKGEYTPKIHAMNCETFAKSLGLNLTDERRELAKMVQSCCDSAEYRFHPPTKARPIYKNFYMSMQAFDAIMRRVAPKQAANSAGYVYIMNFFPYDDGVYKIGFTCRDPRDRLGDFKTGCANAPRIEYSVECSAETAKLCETIVHAILAEFRRDTGEFFAVGLCRAITVCTDSARFLANQFGSPGPVDPLQGNTSLAAKIALFAATGARRTTIKQAHVAFLEFAAQNRIVGATLADFMREFGVLSPTEFESRGPAAVLAQ